MVFVEISDDTERESLAAFLDAAFGGSVFDRESGLELDLHAPGTPPQTELRVAEDLVRAWRASECRRGETEVTLVASAGLPSAGVRHRLARRRLRL